MITYAEVPDDRITSDYLGERYNIAEAKARVGIHDRFIQFTKHNAIDAPALFDEVWEFYRNVGVTSWQSRGRLSLYGASLYYNPAHDPSMWHLGSFGTPRFSNLPESEYYNAPVQVEKYGGGKADYIDPYAFRKQHPFIAERLPNLRAFFESFNFPVTRVTARTLNGLFNIGGGYHIDSKDTFSIRLNFCLSTNGKFGLSYQNGPVVMFEPGDAHMVCTARHHSAYASERCNFQRTNLIVDVIPWYDYDPILDGWKPNQYFGKIHPYDMVEQGIVTFG